MNRRLGPALLAVAGLVIVSLAFAGDLLAQGGCGKCTDFCLVGGSEWGHVADEHEQFSSGEGAGWHNGDCLPGPGCQVQHSPCDGCLQCEQQDDPDFLAFSEVQEVLAAFASDALGPLELLQTFQANVELNRAREALQVLSCDGHVLAHLQLSAAVFEDLVQDLDYLPK